MLCVGEGLGAGTSTTAAASPGGCNNWSVWGIGSRLQWDVTKSFYVGVEALYQNEHSGTTSDRGVLFRQPLLWPTAGATTVANQSNWTFTIRMHKDCLP